MQGIQIPEPTVASQPKTQVKQTKYGQGYDAIDWKKGKTGGAATKAVTAGAASQALEVADDTRTVGGRSPTGAEMADHPRTAKLFKWLDKHPWIKKMLKGVGKGASVIGWLMLAYEIWRATKDWLDVRSDWNLSPMSGGEPEDTVWQKEMGRIAAGYSAAMFGSIAGGMVGTMVAGPVGGVVGGIGGGGGVFLGAHQTCQGQDVLAPLPWSRHHAPKHHRSHPISSYPGAR